MGHNKQLAIQIDDYNRLISETLYSIGAVKECPYCHIEYLTGKDENLIYGSVTNAFKKQYGESNYDNALMKELIKKYLNERLDSHECNED